MERPRIEEIKACGEQAIKVLYFPSGKNILLPTYMSKVRNKNDLEIFCEAYALNQVSKEYIGGLLFDMISASILISEKTKLSKISTKTMDLNGNIIPDNYSIVRESIPFFIDPQTELFYYNINHLKDSYLKTNPPEYVKNLLSSEKHNKKWNQIENTNKTPKLVEWNIKEQSRLGSEAITPPTPFLNPESGYWMLNLAFRINTLNKVSCLQNQVHPAAYFSLDYRLFTSGNEKYLTRIHEFIENLDEVKIVFLKIVNYQSLFTDDNPKPIKLFGHFLRELGRLSKLAEKTIIIMDADTFGYVNLFNRIDGFVEPLNMNTKLMARGGGSKVSYGKIYDMDNKCFISKDDFLEEVKNNNGLIPNHTPFVQGYQRTNFRSMDVDSWNIFRRKLLLESRNYEIGEVHDAIKKDNVRGVIDKIKGNLNYLHLLE